MKNLKREFKVFKEGVTTKGKIVILSMNGEPFDREKKIQFYKDLGYSVYDLQGKEI